MTSMTTTESTTDFAALKRRQQGVWATGDYSVVGTTLQIVGENLCEAIDLRPGWTVLDVAAGNGNATLAAARRGADVTSTDYVPSLLDAARRRAESERLAVHFQEADAENLPFPDGSFDVVLSTFGVMFTPDQEKAAAEMLRVSKPGGRIGLANWTPDGFVGQMFKVIGKYSPPPDGVRSPARWGTLDGVQELFGSAGRIVASRLRRFQFRYRSAEEWLDVFRTYYGPMNRTFAALPSRRADQLRSDLLDLAQGANRSVDGALIVPSSYLEIVLERR
jgi:ubiquinone/menaquinone biosynthesis C-methylase UbiE